MKFNLEMDDLRLELVTGVAGGQAASDARSISEMASIFASDGALLIGSSASESSSKSVPITSFSCSTSRPIVSPSFSAPWFDTEFTCLKEWEMNMSIRFSKEI